MSIITELINPFIEVRNKIRTSTGWEDLKKTEENMFNRTGLRQTPEIKVFEIWGKKVIIESLHYACTGSCYPKLLITKNSGNNWVDELLHVPYNGGSSSGRTYPTPSGIKNNDSSYLKHIYTAGEVDPISVIKLERPIILSNGGQLIFNGKSTDEVTYNLTYRVVEN